MPKRMPWNITITSRKLELTAAGLQKITECKEKPARRVGGGRSNVCFRFPSQKMGVVIQAESRMLELPCMLALEKDQSVLEYYDQPFRIKVTYEGKDGRKRSHYETPDYYVHTRDGRHSIIECKPLNILQEKGKSCPTRYCQDTDGEWISPAGIEAAEAMGCEYLLFTEEHVSIILARNIRFLVDYMRASADEAYASRVPEIQKRVQDYGSIQLKKLIASIGDANAIYYAILHEKIIFLLEEELLIYPELAWVHTDQVHADFHRELKRTSHLDFKATSCRIGDVYEWRNTQWRIVNLDRQKVDLIDEKGELISPGLSGFQKRVTDGEIKLVERTDRSEVSLENVSSRDIDEALMRLQWVNHSIGRPCTHPPDSQKSPPSSRTIRRWVANFLSAESDKGRGVLGLLPKITLRGNRQDRLDEHAEKLIAESIKKDFNNKIAPSILNAYRKYSNRMNRMGLIPVCYETYRRKIQDQDNQESITARFGWKAAYQSERPAGTDTGIPVHGDRPWEIAHIDHTEMDVLVVSAITGKVLGRAWLTVMVDACSGMPLAFSLSLEPPSYRSNMRVIRDCVRRHGQLPDVIVSDQGADFNSRYYEQLLGIYSITKQERPSSNARQGGPVERKFGGLTKEVIHSLPGNIKANKHGRAQTRKTHAPETHATLTMENLFSELDDHLFETYPYRISKGIKEKPIERMKRLLELSGDRKFKTVPYDEGFINLTLPAPRIPTRTLRMGRAVQVNHMEYYGEILRRPEVEGVCVPVRYDPYDISYINIEINHKWYRLETTHVLVREYTERGILFSNDEIGARGQLTNQEIRAARLAGEEVDSLNLKPGSGNEGVLAVDYGDTEFDPGSIDDVTADSDGFQWNPVPVHSSSEADA